MKYLTNKRSSERPSTRTTERPTERLKKSRRDFLKMIGGLSALTVLPTQAFAAHSTSPISPSQIQLAEKQLSLINLHTGESFESTFFSDGQFHHDQLSELNHVLRDHRNDQVHAMDQNLLLLLHNLQQTFGEQKPIQVISAYRSPASNELLRQNNKKVAKKSFHMRGMAIDIRIPDVDLKDLHAASLSMKAGGVGLYTRSNFVHLDVGRVRQWGR